MRELTLAGALLDPLLAADPVGPRITFYDNATGERIELSAVTLANWAAKTANLLRDEYGAGSRGSVAGFHTASSMPLTIPCKCVVRSLSTSCKPQPCSGV